MPTLPRLPVRLHLGLALALAVVFGSTGLAQDAPPTGAPSATFTPAPSPTPASPTAPLTKSQTAGQGSSSKSISLAPSGQSALDYAAWETLATRAENTLAEDKTSDAGLELLRGQLVEWRSKLQAAQTANSSRVQSLRDQITALGPVPAEGAEEAPEIAARRKELSEQLARAEAPGRAAEEAYRRANGLVAEVDGELRARQTEQLLKLWPTPANPANWALAVQSMRNVAVGLVTEVRGNWNRPTKKAQLFDMLPAVAILLVLGLVLTLQARSWIERFANWLNAGAGTGRWRKVMAFFASLGQVIVPTLGVLLLSVALAITEMPGYLGMSFLESLTDAGFALFVSYWLGGRIFPRDDCNAGPLGLSADHCAEGRFLTTMIGLVQGAEILRASLFPPALVAEAALPVLGLPLLLVMAFLLWRMGKLLNGTIRAAAEAQEGPDFRNRVIQLVGKLMIVIAVVAPVLALIGYMTAAAALIYPAAGSLALIGVLLVLVQLISDIYRAIIRAETEDQGQGLLPVLAGFVLTISSLPLFAMLWGARVEDMGEIWNRFTNGFMLGETRISPSNFLYFLILFGIGYGVTKLFQGALKSSILPKTKLDQGGRNAIVAGTGYIGVFIAGVVAFSAAGIDLSGLAIVASALSLGIGFGLQNIVSNFVSGVILLIERPVSEGDWIEVGTVSGTVKAISVRSTRIQTFDRSDVIVPNADLVTQRVTNWTRFNLSGRIIVPVGVDYESDTRKVARVLQEIAEAQPMALLNPPPQVIFMGLGADSLNFEIRMIIRDVNFSLTVRNEVNHEIVRRFREEAIAMPFNQRDIWFKNPQDLADALARTRAEHTEPPALTRASLPLAMPRAGADDPAALPDAAQRDTSDALDNETER
ncbi:DUF3772 domain-containing protein [Gemmobacter denitrificans]|uniref:DUF3772 domain-containing protein n=1 Tax=Gemmobacter denitrificans TaxID=3123040 RepID=A0ABU8BY47_9RHOB